MRLLGSADSKRFLVYFFYAFFLFTAGCQSESSEIQADEGKSQQGIRQGESSANSARIAQEPDTPQGSQTESSSPTGISDFTSEQVASLFEEFRSRVDEYVELRRRVEQEVMKPDAEETPEAIQNYQERLAERLIEARSNSQQGDIFFAEIRPWFRSTINNTLSEKNKAVLIENIEELGARQVDPKVNVIYPRDHGLSFVFPKLLRAFPELPEDVQYRFAGTSIILLDRDILLILDYLPEAYE